MTATQTPTVDVDINSSLHHANPYPTYAWMRQHAPVAIGRMRPFGKVWLVTRYDDVLQGLKHPALSSDLSHRTGNHIERTMSRWAPRILMTLQNSMVTTDDPDHKRLRDLVHVAFTPRVIERMAKRIDEVSRQLLERAAAKREVDLIGEYALPLPLTVISEMIGVPDDEHDRFHRWSARFLAISSQVNPLVMLAQVPNGVRLMRYFERLIEQRRQAPRDDLISALMQAEANGARLTEHEVVSMIFLLLLAGHETTVNLIGGGLLALMEHPEEMQKLRAHPEYMGTAIEELLRFCNPVEHGNIRIALEDVELAGHHIPKGGIVLLLLSSANRDESVFADPDRLDITRDPNRHLAFGFGIHYCLGAPLARLEGRIALQQLVNQFPRMRLAVAPDQLRWRTAIATRGLERLPMHLGA
jgi:cytochrome P450 PksS